MSITRRLFLRNSAVAGAAAATAAVPTVAEAKSISPRERLDAAIAELKAASEAIWPQIEDWTTHIDVTRAVPVMLVAFVPAHLRGDEINVYVDDGSPLRADDVTGTTEYANWEKRRAQS
jgi:hypothetical protein